MKKDSILRDKNLYIVFAVSMMGLMSVSAIAPAFPRMIQELNLTTAQIGLIVTSYALPSAILAPVFGVLADRYGRRITLALCLFLFGISGFACGLVDNFNVLLLLRAFQGIGASAFASVSITLIADIYSGQKVAEAMGYNSMVISISVAIYPILGGALATMDWHYPFLLPILAVPVGLAVLFMMDYTEPKRSESMRDYLIGIWQCLKDVHLLGFIGACAVSFLLLYGAFITYFPIFMAERFNASPFIIGLITSLGSLSMAISSSQAGRFFQHFSPGTMLKMGFIGFMVGAALVPFMPSLLFIIVPGIVVNFGMGIILPCIQTSMSQKAPPEYRGAVMSLNSTAIRVGQTVGPPVMSLPYGIGSFDAVYFAAAALSLLMLIIAIVSGRLFRHNDGT
jgi:predicted MFS family arabinose efflux permease